MSIFEASGYSNFIPVPLLMDSGVFPKIFYSHEGTQFNRSLIPHQFGLANILLSLHLDC